MYDNKDDLSIEIVNSPLLDGDVPPCKYLFLQLIWFVLFFVAACSIVSKFKKETNV